MIHSTLMQFFNFYLTDLLDSGRYQASILAEEAGIHPSEISKIKKGRVVGASFAERIIGALEPKDRPEALAAWVRDQVPTKFNKLVTILPQTNSRVKDKRPSASSLEGALEVLHGASGQSKHVRAVIMNLAKAWQE